MNAEPKRTNFTCYKRVSAVLNSDNALKKKLGDKTVAVGKPDQSSEDFPVGVILVTDELHATGKDARSIPVIEVIKCAHRLLVLGEAPTVIAPPPPPPPPPAPPAAKIPSKKEKPAAVAKTKAAKPRPARQPKPVAKPVAKPAAVAAAAATATANTAEPPVPPVTMSSPAVTAATASTAKTIVTNVRPNVPYVVGVAALSNLQAVITLLEPYVTNGDTEARDLCQKVDKIIDEVHRRTCLPTQQSSAEKEPAKSN